MQQHAASVIAHTEASTGSELPRFVKDEFDAFLECGILAHGFLRLRCGECGHDRLIQRFGSVANLNLHLHCLVLGGVYQCGDDGEPVFIEVDAPTDDELHALLQTVITRLMQMLTRRGVLVEDTGQTYLAESDADSDEARTLRPLQAAAITYRIAFGPRAGQKVLTLRGAMPRETAAHQPLCADIDGFSLHAAVRVEAHDRKRLEQLCRTITRPALSDERVQLNAAGQVELKLKTPWRDGTTHLVMSPLEFMQRLAALVPRPRLHLIRFHGVLAPNAKLRALVVPQRPPEQERPATEAAAAAGCEAETVQAWPHRISWARLLKRVFDIDMQHCPNCGGGELKIIAAILERPAIEKILGHLGLDPQPPPKGRAREAGQDFAT
ncbi:MAG: transposase [Betaproteobacteria bacterium]